MTFKCSGHCFEKWKLNEYNVKPVVTAQLKNIYKRQARIPI